MVCPCATAHTVSLTKKDQISIRVSNLSTLGRFRYSFSLVYSYTKEVYWLTGIVANVMLPRECWVLLWIAVLKQLFPIYKSVLSLPSMLYAIYSTTYILLSMFYQLPSSIYALRSTTYVCPLSSSMLCVLPATLFDLRSKLYHTPSKPVYVYSLCSLRSISYSLRKHVA